jgi:hypothetical protein
MKQTLKEFKFFEIYETASWLEAAAMVPESFIEVPWEDESVARALGHYSKVSLLHYYIYHLLASEKRREYRKNLYDRMPDEIDDFRGIFKDYQIDLRDEKDFQPYYGDDYDDYDEYEHFYLWFQFHEESFTLLWKKITDEVFHLLFANRGFLLIFNKSLSSFLEYDPNLIPLEHRDNKGKIKRASNIPVWAKKAVYFRDQGRCVLCFKDLTGLLSTDQVIHYDHIVPLNCWGVNDPCNLQLLCKECNLKKGGIHASTSSRYREWW